LASNCTYVANAIPMALLLLYLAQLLRYLASKY